MGRISEAKTRGAAVNELEKEIEFLKSPCGQLQPNMHTRIETNDRECSSTYYCTYKDFMGTTSRFIFNKEKEDERRTA